MNSGLREIVAPGKPFSQVSWGKTSVTRMRLGPELARLTAEGDCRFSHASNHGCRAESGLLEKVTPACKSAFHFSSKS
jgi:hypothetical protein